MQKHLSDILFFCIFRTKAINYYSDDDDEETRGDRMTRQAGDVCVFPQHSAIIISHPILNVSHQPMTQNHKPFINHSPNLSIHNAEYYQFSCRLQFEPKPLKQRMKIKRYFS